VFSFDESCNVIHVAVSVVSSTASVEPDDLVDTRGSRESNVRAARE